jgi:hypothetical protein
MVISGEEPPKGTAIGSLFISPANHWHATIPLNLPAAGTLTVFNNGAQPLQLKQTRVSNEAFQLTVTTLEAGKRYQFNLSVKEGLPVGLHKAVLTIETDSTETPKLEIPLNLTVVAPITVNPAKLMMDNVYVSQADYDVTTYAKFTWVRFERGEGLELKSLTSDLPFLVAKVESVEGNKQTYLLRVTFKDRPTVGTHTGKLRIETNHKDVPLLEVPVTVVAK